MIEVIRKKVKEKLEQTEIFGAVYDHLVQDPKGYPCAMIHYDGVRGELIDSCTYKRTYALAVYMMQEIGQRTREQATETIEQAVDHFITAIEKDRDLGNTVSNIALESGEISEYVNGSDGHSVRGIVALTIETLHHK